MAETNGTNGGTEQPDLSAGQPQVNVIGQYIKDLSFECPDPTRFFRGPGNNPNLQLNFNVQVNNVQDGVFEVGLSLEGEAKSDEGVLYNIELLYAGAFHLKNLPQEAIQPVLFIECPALLFPFVRRLVADLTREGGFPPLLLDPIDFAGLYRRRAAEGQQPTVS
ncbi:preprotein translocase subunit SecB [Rhodomicrobium udaipurense JA643]|uniref:Protein-export protein SecB n=1 Tax=Rhodomicrobium udaipurense TaxID=1202716 RepID=A0A8I1KFT6_9HYPH|nr:protein-export chaperone SecB [Rhodomicrobium udaipurense]KAI93407.1 preprotein translocase subunit SecB [Rhodomicrobium udaipurense JA643]MBJ7542050.1 protein-export chaperone SecB [Rhodomicrobium udaipurense]